MNDELLILEFFTSVFKFFFLFPFEGKEKKGKGGRIKPLSNINPQHVKGLVGQLNKHEIKPSSSVMIHSPATEFTKAGQPKF